MCWISCHYITMNSPPDQLFPILLFKSDPPQNLPVWLLHSTPQKKLVSIIFLLMKKLYDGPQTLNYSPDLTSVLMYLILMKGSWFYVSTKQPPLTNNLSLGNGVHAVSCGHVGRASSWHFPVWLLTLIHLAPQTHL